MSFTFHPAVDWHTLIIASAPALFVLIVAVIVVAIVRKRTYDRAVADGLRQARLELDLLRRSAEAGIEQLQEDVQRQQKDLNTLRAEAVDRLRSVQTRLESASKEPRPHQHTAFDFRPGAFETLWNKVLKIREFVAPVLAIYSLPSATDFLPVDERLRVILPKTAEQDFRADAEGLREGTENLRPFLGEDVWQIFSVYYAYAIRSAWKVVAGKMTGHIPPWDKDFEGNDDVRSLLSLVLTDEELSTAIGDQPTGAPPRILTALECMMLDAMNVWMFGSPLSQLGLKDRERVAQATLPEADLAPPAPRPSNVPILGTLRLSSPKFKKSINPRLKLK
jgi:hypothetical protein